MPPEGSEQQAPPRVFVPLCFLQGAEGHLGGLSEDVLHVLPKLGRTFQVEGGLHLLAGVQALGEEGTAFNAGPGAWGASRHPLVGLGLALGAAGPWCGAPLAPSQPLSPASFPTQAETGVGR